MAQLTRIPAAEMSKPKLVVMRGATKQVSIIALDLADEAEALVVAKKHLVASTGRSVTVCNAFGEILETVQAPAHN